MKRIAEYRKLFNITKDEDLSTLKKIYKDLMKQWHPDKFTEDEAQKAVAEEKSKRIIGAYHFLVSISPETHTSKLEEYTAITTSRIDDFMYKGQTLKITFSDGHVYEYFGVPSNVYNKFMNSDSPSRFGRRHIFHAFIYRNAGKQNKEEK